MVQRSLSQPPPLPHGWPSPTTKPRTAAPPSCLSSSPALNRPRQCYLDLKLLSLSSLSHPPPPPSTAVGRPRWRGSQRGDGDQAERRLKRWWRGLEDDDRLDDLERARRQAAAWLVDVNKAGTRSAISSSSTTVSSSSFTTGLEMGRGTRAWRHKAVRPRPPQCGAPRPQCVRRTRAQTWLRGSHLVTPDG